MALTIDAAVAAEPKPPAASQQKPDEPSDCGVKPAPEQKPAYLSDNSSKREKLAFPQDKQAYAAAQYPQDQHEPSREMTGEDGRYPQDGKAFASQDAFPQDRPLSISGCPSQPSHTHS